MPYKKISGTWTETQFVKIGGAVKTSAVLGTPYNHAFNGVYDSDWFSISTSTMYLKSHNLSTDKYDVICYGRNSSDTTYWGTIFTSYQAQEPGPRGARITYMDKLQLGLWCYSSLDTVNMRITNSTGSIVLANQAKCIA